MRTLTSTELGRRLREVLDGVEFRGEEFMVARNDRPVARLSPAAPAWRALEVLADLYDTVPADAGAAWLDDAGGAP